MSTCEHDRIFHFLSKALPQASQKSFPAIVQLYAISRLGLTLFQLAVSTGTDKFCGGGTLTFRGVVITLILTLKIVYYVILIKHFVDLTFVTGATVVINLIYGNIFSNTVWEILLYFHPKLKFCRLNLSIFRKSELISIFLFGKSMFLMNRDRNR